LAWAEYSEEDCDGKNLDSNVIAVVKADDINEIWAQDYDEKIIGPEIVEKVVHSCETWGDGSYYYWGDEVLESMALDMTFEWTESEDSASMITSSLLMIIAAFAMIFAWEDKHDKSAFHDMHFVKNKYVRLHTFVYAKYIFVNVRWVDKMMKACMRVV